MTLADVSHFIGETGWTPLMQGELSLSKTPLYNTMRRILSDMQADPQAWAFLQPVSAEDVPDYYTVIKNPMGKVSLLGFQGLS